MIKFSPNWNQQGKWILVNRLHFGCAYFIPLSKLTAFNGRPHLTSQNNAIKIPAGRLKLRMLNTMLKVM